MKKSIEMNKLIIGIAIGLLIGLLGYCFLNLFSSNERLSKDFSRVIIKNESGRNIKKVVLQHGRGSVEATGLNMKGEIQFIFQNNAENSYNITATFDNDSILSSKPVYIEYGYRGTVIVKETEIVTENNW